MWTLEQLLRLGTIMRRSQRDDVSWFNHSSWSATPNMLLFCTLACFAKGAHERIVGVN